MSIKCEVKVKHNYKIIENVLKELPKVIEKSVEEVLKNIQTTAIKLERGNNESGILVELIDTSTMQVKGRVYADPKQFIANGQSYLWFEYFGTGQFAEQDHIGTTKHFIESGYTEWYIPVNKVDRKLNYPIKTINGKDFYIAHGAQGNHFLEDSEFQTRNDNIEIVKKNLDTMFKEVCK